MKNKLNENIRSLRKTLGITQEEFASKLKIKRSLVGAYEEGRAEPRLELLCKMAEMGGISVEELLQAPEFKPMFKKTKKTTIQKNISILSKSTARQIDISPAEGRNNIELVPVKAAAGYLNGYADPEYVQELPRFSLPMLNQGTYRAFEISGESMLPLQSGTIVVGEHVQRLNEIKNGKTYVLVTRTEGVVYKRVFNYVEENGKLFLVSDNRQFAPYQIEASDVLEIWYAKAYISLNFPE